MSAKRLHVHSVPLVLFALAVTALLALPAAWLRADSLRSALARSAIRVEATDHGLVKIVANEPVSEESAGLYVELPKGDPGVIEASQAAGALDLHLVLSRVAQ